MLRLVLKRLDGEAIREAAIYERIVSKHAPGLAPRLLGVVQTTPGSVVLGIEAVRRTRAWPWRNLSAPRLLLERLARFHHAAKPAISAVPAWDYEKTLDALAEETWVAVDRCRHRPDLWGLANHLRPLRRIILALPDLRRQLLSDTRFGIGPIHGDVHSGNALMRRRMNGDEPILLDWGRARRGSPLEDVASWLQSLGYWESEAKRYHDTLLKDYLTAFGIERKLTSDMRSAYWMAGASNALAGALLHHICVAVDEHVPPSRRAAAFRAARDWLRVVRRAAAWWC